MAKTVVIQIPVLDKLESSGNGHEIILAKPAAAFGELTKPLNTQQRDSQLRSLLCRDIVRGCRFI